MTDLDPTPLQDDQQFSDDTDTSGGGSEPSPEPQSRRLRDDATSDPMRRQTEPDQQSLDPQTNAQSPSRSAGPASSGGDPQGQPTEDTASEPSNSPARSGSGPQAVESGSRQDRPSGGASDDQLAKSNSPSQPSSSEQRLDPQEVAGRDTTDEMDNGGGQTPDRTTDPASGPTQEQRDEAVGRYIANNPEKVDTGADDPDGGVYDSDEIEVYETESGEFVVGPSEEAQVREQTPRANQSRSFSTTGTPSASSGAVAPTESDAREQTPRANQSRSFGTTGTPSATRGALDTDRSAPTAADPEPLNNAIQDAADEMQRERELQETEQPNPAGARGEQFGDSEINIPGTDISGEDLTRMVSRQADEFGRDAGNAIANLTDPDSYTVQDPNLERREDGTVRAEQPALSFDGDVTRQPGGDNVATRTGRRGIAGVAGAVLTLPAAPANAARTVDEGVELAGYAAQESVDVSDPNLQQRSDGTVRAESPAVQVDADGASEVAGDFGGAAEEGLGQAVDAAVESPARTTGMVVGSLGASGAAFRATANAGRLGTATRYAIQPGEEIAGSAGFRATRRLAGKGAAQRAFPNREPVVFSEEAAIRGARGARSRASDAVDVARREFSGTDRAQAGPGSLLGESRSTNAESGRTRSGAESEIDMERLQSNLESFEVAERMRGANERAEQRFLDEQMEAGELQERGDEPRTVDSGVEGGSLSDTRETFTASRAPDTSRSGPTPGQQAAYRSARRSRNTDYGDPLRLSPRESRLAASAPSSPTDDLRDIVSVERRLTGEMERDGFTTAELDAETAVRSGARAPRRRFETALETGATSRMQSDAVGSEVLASVESSELAGEVGATSPISDTRVAQSPMARVGSDTAQNVATEIGQEFETVQDSRSDMLAEPVVSAEAEAGFDTRVGSEFETRTRSELEVETEAETEAELESESRQEFEGFDTRGDRRRDERGVGGLTASAARLNRDLRNPFTGR